MFSLFRSLTALALAGFYKRADIDIVREQIEQALAVPGGKPLRYGIFDEGLIVFPGDGFETEVVYNLRSRRVRAKVRGAPYTGDLPSLANRHALFGREPLFATVWSTAWHHVMQGLEPLHVVGGPPLVREEAPAQEPRPDVVPESHADVASTEARPSPT